MHLPRNETKTGSKEGYCSKLFGVLCGLPVFSLVFRGRGPLLKASKEKWKMCASTPLNNAMDIRLKLHKLFPIKMSNW